MLRPLRRNFGRDKAFYRKIDDLLGFIPHNIELYKLALIHKSASLVLDDGRQINNERLEFLGERLRADGYPAVLAQNAQGMYRVVACSFDDRATAVQAREGLQAKYPQFTDAWFLINK